MARKICLQSVALMLNALQIYFFKRLHRCNETILETIKMENLTFNYVSYLGCKLKFTWNSHKNCALQSDYNFIYIQT
jgi:hypothetical protein